MKSIRDELQNIIFGNGQIGHTSQLKKTQNFLRRNASAGIKSEKSKSIKRQEETALNDFLENENLIYRQDISESGFISAGAEQRVYKFDDFNVVKANEGVFYSTWFDYLNSLLIHNYFFNSTAYEFLGFQIHDGNFSAIVKQEFIIATETTDLSKVKSFLEYNGFANTRNNDYRNDELGIIFEDLHDENVLSRNDLLYFVDTVFYLTEHFHSNG